jgi:carbamate kinase
VSTDGRRVLIAVGGNALVREGEAGTLELQYVRAQAFAVEIAELVADGWQVLVTHGNGPQVGFILRRGELAGPAAASEGVPDLPLWLAVADSQGGIGHLLALALDAEFASRGHGRRAAVLLTHVLVDADDPAFSSPTKPIGGVLTAAQAAYHEAEHGWQVQQTGADRWRRVVASPRPIEVVEAEHVATLCDAGAVVVAGGGIPVVADGHGWRGVDAVIDKDRTSALLAAQVGVDSLVLVTGVDAVAVDFGRPAQRSLREVDADELARHLAEGQFPPGSMGPKVEAALDYVRRGGGTAIITSLPQLRAALAGQAGTHVLPTPTTRPTDNNQEGR